MLIKKSVYCIYTLFYKQCFFRPRLKCCLAKSKKVAIKRTVYCIYTYTFADYVYEDKFEGMKIEIGDEVIGAPDYKVISIVRKKMQWLTFDQDIRLVVAAKWCWWSCTPTIIVSFMGTKGVVQVRSYGP